MITAVELPIIEQRIAAAKTKYAGLGIDTDEITCTVEALRAWAKARGYTVEYSSSMEGYILKW
jgi:hypothetical protein